MLLLLLSCNLAVLAAAAKPPDYSVLARRISAAKSDTATVKCLLLDSMLPRQRLEMHFSPPATLAIKEAREGLCALGLIGIDPQTGEVARRGVEARIESMSKYRANYGYFSSHALSGSTYSTRGFEALDTVLVGGRTFDICSHEGPWPPEEPVVTAEVRWAPEASSASAAAAIVLAEQLAPLVAEWLELVRSGERERTPGQMERVLNDLGPMPDAAEGAADDCALWVGALINPIPAIGVCKEVRAQLLAAEPGKRRVEWALAALRDSIKRMRERPPGPFEVEPPPRSRQ